MDVFTLKVSQRLKLVLVITFAFLISACGGGSSSPETIEESPSAEDLLQGNPYSLAVEALPPYFPNPPSADDFVVASVPGLVSGLKVHKSRIVVKLNSAATIDEVNNLLETVGAAVAGRAIDGVIYVDLLNSPSQEELVSAISTFEASPVVDLAVEDVLVETNASGEVASLYMLGNCTDDISQPNASEWTGTSLAGQGERGWVQNLVEPGPDVIGKTRPHGNWWLEFVRMPAVWNFNDAINRRALVESKDVYDLALPIGVVDEGFQQHIDIPLTNYKQMLPKCHGNMVAGIIAASHRTNAITGIGIGIDGMNPYARILDSNVSKQIEAGLKTSAESIDLDLDGPNTVTQMSIVSSIYTMLENPLGKVINLSYGIDELEYIQLVSNSSDDPDVKDYVNKISQLTWGVIKDRDVLIVVGAANNSNLVSNIDNGEETSHGAISAKWSGPFHYLALEGFTNSYGELVKADNVLVVESVGWQGSGGRRNWDSSVGGHIAAPGACITSTSINNSYATSSGTSFAAPIISGLASYLSMIDPGLTAIELKNIILQSARPRGSVTENYVFGDNCSSEPMFSLPNEPDQPPIVDAYAAVMQIDGSVRKLVDTDDGTADGVTVMGENESIRLPGDGEVSMADFRAFRDAVLQLRGETLAEPYHIKRDNNRDGCVWDGLNCTVPEEIWSRFDFNGDGILHETITAKLRLPGDSPVLANIPDRTDLDILADVWPSIDENCGNRQHPESEGWCANDLSGLIESRDVIVDFSAFNPKWGETIKVRVEIGVFSHNRLYHHGDDPVMVFTIPHDADCALADPVNSRCHRYKISATSNGTSIVMAGGVNQGWQGASTLFYNQPFGHDEMLVLLPQVTLTLAPFAGKSFETEMTAVATYTFDDLTFLYDPDAARRRDEIRLSCGVSNCANVHEIARVEAGMSYRFTPTVNGEFNLVFAIRNFCENPIQAECPIGSPISNLIIPFTVVEGTPPEPEPLPEPEPEPEPLPPIDPPPLPPIQSWTAVGYFSYESEYICNEAAKTITWTINGTEPGYQTKADPGNVQEINEHHERKYDNPIVCGDDRYWRPGRTFYKSERGHLQSSVYAGVGGWKHIGDEAGSRILHSKANVVGNYATCPGQEDLKSGCYPYVWHSGYRSDGEPYGYYTFSKPGGDAIFPPFPPAPTF